MWNKLVAGPLTPATLLTAHLALSLPGLCSAAGSGSMRQHRHSAASRGPGDPGHAHPAPGCGGQVLEGSLHGGRQVLGGKEVHVACEPARLFMLEKRHWSDCLVVKSPPSVGRTVVHSGSLEWTVVRPWKLATVSVGHSLTSFIVGQPIFLNTRL